MPRRLVIAPLALLILASTAVGTAERRWTPDTLMRVKRITSVIPS